MKNFYTAIFAVSTPSKNLVNYFFSDIFPLSILSKLLMHFFYMLYSFITSLLTLSGFNV